MWFIEIHLPDDPQPYEAQARNQTQLKSWYDRIKELWPDSTIWYTTDRPQKVDEN
jgi:hypothetical protein